MSTTTDRIRTFNNIAAEYAPYDQMPAFMEGATAYMERRYDQPYGDSVAGQAWDRGMECAMRFTRQHGRYA
jgi:hypothetical protein